uniref:Secreted protein n=1 Tax=Anguilla anguilla TaxID=7936 RepID=A0A0E9SG25_ANGAN
MAFRSSSASLLLCTLCTSSLSTAVIFSFVESSVSWRRALISSACFLYFLASSSALDWALLS